MSTPEQHRLAWQGWNLVVPRAWNPVKIDGDAFDGALLLADLHAPRLGLRWKRAAKRGDPAEWATRAMADEVGAHAAAEAIDFAMPDPAAWAVSRLYRDPAPPGRDVWVGVSRRSGRSLQIVHHAAKGGSSCVEPVLRSLDDSPVDAPTRWSIFDLSFVAPPGVAVRWYRFNAGDLSVGLIDARRRITVVRQLAPASVALARQLLPAWLRQQSPATKRLYRPREGMDFVTPAEAVALRGELVRRRRYAWAWFVPPRLHVVAIHAPARDRLVLGQSADDALLTDVLASVGWNDAEAA